FCLLGCVLPENPQTKSITSPTIGIASTIKVMIQSPSETGDDSRAESCAFMPLSCSDGGVPSLPQNSKRLRNPHCRAVRTGAPIVVHRHPVCMCPAWLRSRRRATCLVPLMMAQMHTDVVQRHEHRKQVRDDSH